MRRGSIIAGLAVAGALSAAPSQGAAGEPAGRVLGLGECVRLALAEGPDRDLIAADLSAAKARLEEARAGKFGDTEYTQLFGLINEAEGDAVFSPNSQTDFFDGLGPFTRLHLDIRLPLYTFGKLSAALEAAEQGLRGERARGDMARAETVLETKRLYYGLQLAEQLGYLLKEMLESMDEAIDKTQKRLDDGSRTVTERDVLRLKIGRSRFAAGVEEVEASTRLTKSALARAVGLDPRDAIEIADKRMEMAEVQLDSFDAYASSGPQRRPEWRRLVSGLEAQQARVELQEASYYPTLFLATGVRYAYAGNRDDQKNPFVYDDYNFLEPIGVLGLHWDLNVFANRAKAAQERAAMEKLRAERRRAESGLRLEVERSYVAVEQARATIESVRAGRKAARGLLVLTVANFDLGIGEGDELFEAYGAYTETSTDYFRAVHDYNVAVAELSRAVGEELLDLEY
jgi:outer membrane protein TolC